jgi:hypothetical protein
VAKNPFDTTSWKVLLVVGSTVKSSVRNSAQRLWEYLQDPSGQFWATHTGAVFSKTQRSLLPVSSWTVMGCPGVPSVIEVLYLLTWLIKGSSTVALDPILGLTGPSFEMLREIAAKATGVSDNSEAARPVECLILTTT